jgi:hypothetical protein
VVHARATRSSYQVINGLPEPRGSVALRTDAPWQRDPSG